MSEHEQPRPFVQSLERGLAVIRAFDAEHRRLSISEVARRSGLDRAAARRFLLTLAQLGYVGQDHGSFSLRPRVLELGYAYLSTLTLPEVAQPHMERLASQLDESTSIAVLDDLDIVYAVRVPTRRIMSVSIAVGTRFPAWATSMGRVLLAGLAPRRAGVAAGAQRAASVHRADDDRPRRPARRAGAGARARLGDRRPGARGRPALRRRSDQRRARRRGGGAQRLRRTRAARRSRSCARASSRSCSRRPGRSSMTCVPAESSAVSGEDS